MKAPRRQFLKYCAATCGSLAVFPLIARSQSTNAAAPPDSLDRPRQSLVLVKEFVNAAHRNLDTVKYMLEEEPALLYASWDWGNGDWETALEGASHMGRADIVNYLLKKGARANPFCSAMLGQTSVIEALIRAEPAVVQSRAPHYLTLLYHAALSDETELTSMIAAQLELNRAEHFNQAIQGVARLGTANMATWLLNNGVTELNEPNFFGLTPLDEAIERDASDLVEILKSHGGRLAGS